MITFEEAFENGDCEWCECDPYILSLHRIL